MESTHRRYAPSAASVCARQLALGDEPESVAFGESPPVGAGGSGRRHDDGRRVGAARQPGGDLESVHVRKLDVEQHQAWPQPRRLDQRRLAIDGLADDVEPLRFKQCARPAAKLFVVVDDQYRAAHAAIVPSVRGAASGQTLGPNVTY